MVISRFDVYLVRLDPREGHKIQKPRPCLGISPDEMNRFVRTVIVAPMTTTGRDYPSRIAVTFQGRSGWIALAQMRAVDRRRLVQRLGCVSASAADEVLDALRRLFAP
jgi:mRNA interferase MazF